MNNITQNNYNPTFQAYYKSAFGKKLEKVLKTGKGTEEIAEDFAKVVQAKKHSKGARLGSGGFGSVYRIDDYYVFKQPHLELVDLAPLQKNDCSEFAALKTYRGNVIAQIGNIEIKENVTRDRKNFLGMPRPRYATAAYYRQALKEFSSLPQKAFDDLAHDFDVLNKISNEYVAYKFDTNNPNNFIKVGKSIKIVDDIGFVSRKNQNDFYSLIRVFIHEKENTDLTKEIFKKCVLASEKYQLPMEFSYKHLRGVVNKLFESIGISDNFEEFYINMNEFRLQKNHMQLVKQYLENI